MVRVKICGITSIPELRLAEKCGADAIGVLVGQVHRSADFLSPERAAFICRAAAPFLTTVLVTHIKDPRIILELATAVPTTAVQLHSDLDLEVLPELRRALSPRKIIAKVSVAGDASLATAEHLAPLVDALVLDSIDRSTDRVGGTGLTHDWSISARIVQSAQVPVVLAGGLNPFNVVEAVSTVRPWGVDVNSGVEDDEAHKDPELVQKFVRAAKFLDR